LTWSIGHVALYLVGIYKIPKEIYNLKCLKLNKIVIKGRLIYPVSTNNIIESKWLGVLLGTSTNIKKKWLVLNNGDYKN
jgi:hypothetical protein